MAEQIGIVTGIDPGGWARVLTDRNGACGGCHSGHGGGCHSCLAGAKFESRATNTVGAQPGDLVKVSLDSKRYFTGVALLYLLPVAALLIGALAGVWVGGQAGWTETAGGILGAIVGVGVAVLFLVRLDRSKSASRRLTPSVVEVLSSGNSTARPAAVKHACCG